MLLYNCGMPPSIHLEFHLTTARREARYRQARDPVEQNRWYVLWLMTNTVLINRHFANLDELEEAQAHCCVVLQQRRDLIHSATRFHWWPLRIKQRQGPRSR